MAIDRSSDWYIYCTHSAVRFAATVLIFDYTSEDDCNQCRGPPDDTNAIGQVVCRIDGGSVELEIRVDEPASKILVDDDQQNPAHDSNYSHGTCEGVCATSDNLACRSGRGKLDGSAEGCERDQDQAHAQTIQGVTDGCPLLRGPAELWTGGISTIQPCKVERSIDRFQQLSTERQTLG